MALTDVEMADIRLYLGYPNLWRYKNTRLESTFTELDAPAEAQVRAALTAISDFVTSETASGGSGNTTTITTGGLKKVDEIEWYQAGSTTSSTGISTAIINGNARGRQLVGRLSIILGVPIYSDYFGRGGYLGDTYSAGGMPGSGGRNGGSFPVG